MTIIPHPLKVGVLITGGLATVNMAGLEVTPSADRIVTVALPGAAMSAAGTSAVSCTALKLGL